MLLIKYKLHIVYVLTNSHVYSRNIKKSIKTIPVTTPKSFNSTAIPKNILIIPAAILANRCGNVNINFTIIGINANGFMIIMYLVIY